MPRHILIVDDCSEFRAATRRFIEAHSRLRVCGEGVDGRDGIKKAQQLGPDLIVLDLVMPTMNGLQVARVLKRAMPQIPIIAFTLYPEILSEADGRAAGFAAVISKTEPLQLIEHAQSLLKIA